MMKLKIYLRGLGIGMAVTALVIGLGNNKQSISDEEVIDRAIKLGMVENSKLTDTRQAQSQQADESESEKEDDSVSDSDNTPQETASPENPSDDENPTENKSSENKSSENKPSENNHGKDKPSDSTMEDNPAETGRENSNESSSQTAEGGAETVGSTSIPVEIQPSAKGESVTVTVKRGDNSWTVSKFLAAAGLITDAHEYDKYLCDEGYSKKICVGTYEITMGASQEEIAKIITKKN